MAYKQTPVRGKSNSYSSFQQKGFISPLKQTNNPDLAIQAAHRAYVRDPANQPRVVQAPGGLTITNMPGGGKSVVRDYDDPSGNPRQEALNWGDLPKKDQQNYAAEVTRIQTQGFSQTPAYQQYSQNRNPSGKYYNPTSGRIEYRSDWQKPDREQN